MNFYFFYAVLFLTLVSNSFAQNNSARKACGKSMKEVNGWCIGEELKAEARYLPASATDSDLDHERQSVLFISGEAAERIYKDLAVEEKPHIGLDNNKSNKQKISQDNNMLCSKVEGRFNCAIYIDPTIGQGLFKKKEITSTPCNAVSNSDRDDIKDIQNALNPKEKSNKAGKQ